MPPAKSERSVQHEAHLAQRIKAEREARDLSLERLAQKMTEAGCPMDRSAIYKIESGKPPRRITVDEAVTFANVFGLPLSALLLPPSIAMNREAAKLYKRYQAANERYVAAAEELEDLTDRILNIVDAGFHAEVLEALEASSDGPVSHFGAAGLVETFQLLREGKRRIAASNRTEPGAG